MIEFIVPGEPQGKARARVYHHKGLGHSIAVTPEKTVLYENLVKTCYSDQNGQHLGEGPLGISVKAYYSIPKSTSKKKAQRMLDGLIRPTKKPDSDNIGKIIADSLNGVAYKDDSQIVAMVIEKFYGELPRVEVTLMKLKGE